MAAALSGAEDGPQGKTLRLDDIAWGQAPPRQIGNYEIIEVIAHGGMGVVYRARQRGLNREAAIKLLLGGAYAGDKTKRRFWREAQSAAQLRHPNIVPIFEVGEAGDLPFFSMEYVAGRDWGRLLQEGAFEPRAAAKGVKTIAIAVNYAHDHGVIHRDIKPSNILQDAEGNPKITDFGLARIAEDNSDLTLTGQVLGSPGYASPEQVAPDGHVVGPATDVYGLGATLYALLTGRPPFTGTGLELVLREVLSSDPIPPRKLNPAIPPELETICLKCLRKDPKRRYQTPKALAEDLGRFLEGRPIHARPTHWGYRLSKWCARNRGTALMTAAFALVLAAGFVAVSIQWRISESHRTTAENNSRLAQEANLRLRAKLEELKVQRAEAFFRDGNAAFALDSLTGLLEDNPTNAVAAARLVSALSHRRFLTPRARFYCPHFTVMALSGDGRWLAIGSGLGAVQVWELANPQLKPQELSGPPGLASLSFSPQGDLLAAGGGDQIVIWDFPARKRLLSRLLSAGPRRLAFHPNGKSLAIGQRDGGWWIWNLADNTVQFTNHVPAEPVFLRFDKQGERVLIGSQNWAQIWDPRQNYPATGLLAHASDIKDGCFSSDGRFVATCEARCQAHVWDARTGLRVAPPFQHAGEVFSVRFSPDGARLLTASEDGRARIWDIGRAVLAAPPMEHRSWVRVAEFSPDGSRVATGGSDNTIRLWNASTGHAMAEPLGLGDDVFCLQFNSQENQFVAGLFDGTVLLVNTLGVRPPAQSIKVPQGCHSARLSKDGRRALLCLPTLGAEVRSVEQGSMIAALNASNYVITGCFSPSGAQAATCGGNVIQLWDTARGDPLSPAWKNDCEATDIEFDASSGRLAVAFNLNGFCTFDFDSGQVVQQWAATPEKEPCAVAQSANGRVLAFADISGSVLICRSEAGRYGVQSRFAVGAGVRVLALNPEGTLLAVGLSNGMASLWDAATGATKGEPMGHSQVVTCLSFSSDGRRLASGSEDGAVRIWDAESGYPLSETLTVGAPVRAVGFHPSGHPLSIVAGDLSGSKSAFWLWDEAPPSVPVPTWLLKAAKKLVAPVSREVESPLLTSLSTARVGNSPSAGATNEAFYASWYAWFLAAPAHKTVSWGSTNLIRPSSGPG